jgi:rhamnose transport system permease protein
MVATLATFSLYRGIAYVLLGNQAITGYPYEFATLGQGYFPGTNIPNQFVIFIALAVIFGFILHKTTFGRSVYAIGNNEDACRYSGLPVDRIKVILFTVNGLLAGLAAVLLTSRIYSTRPNIALNYELEIITAVVLGGVSIKGGRGSMIGVVLALFLIGASRFGMSLLNIPGQMMTVVIGLMLIIAILLPQLLDRLSGKQGKTA